MQPNPTTFSVVFIAAMAVFVLSCIQRFRLVGIGRAEDRFHHVWLRVRHMLVYAFLQRRVLDKPFGINHFVLFWSFMSLMLANAEFCVHGMFPGVGFASLIPLIHHPLVFIFDLVSLLALLCVIIAAVRRIVWPPYPEAVTLDAFIILSLVGLLMIAFFNLHGIEIAIGKEAAAAFMPVSSAFAAVLYTEPLPYNIENQMIIWWWVHAVVLLTFLNYLPYSKHMHILASIPSCFFRRFERPNTLPQETFVKGGAFGVQNVNQYTWKDLFDAYSCTECGRCQNACPAAATEKPLNPRQVIHDIKVNLLQNGRLLRRGRQAKLPLIGGQGEGSISENAIWSCTTCGACMEVCPVFIEQMPKLIMLRRYLVQMEAKFPEELLNFFENMEQRSNPWGIAPTERTKWSSQRSVRTFDPSTCDYLLYVGCAGAFDARNKQVTVALAMILDAAGISWGILGKEELCCGDSVRRLGNEFVFDRMARANVKLLKDKGVMKIITLCPHCYSTLKNDYRSYGLEVEVWHHAEFIERLLDKGLLKLARPVDMGRTVFHDSCYLGRHNGVYEAPRNVIRRTTGQPPYEMARKRGNSFCCGAGGGRMWMEEHLGTRINLERIGEVLAKHPDTVCVTCPYCMTMFEDGLKDKGAEQVRVKDIGEVVAESLYRARDADTDG